LTHCLAAAEGKRRERGEGGEVRNVRHAPGREGGQRFAGRVWLQFRKDILHKISKICLPDNKNTLKPLGGRAVNT
jgi:hypothetical protein